jgi:hypothetical protein
MRKCVKCEELLFYHSTLGLVCVKNTCSLFKKSGVQKTGSQSSFSRNFSEGI